MASGNGTRYLPGGGEGKVPQWWGMYYGYIAVNADPLAQGRVKLRIPQVFGSTTSGWASPMVPLNYIPKVGTPVTAMFVGGDPSQPVWFGNFALPDGAAGFVIAPAAPAGPEIGEVWVNSTTGLMSEWNGAGWVAYQIGGAAIQTGVGLTAPNITGGVITGAEFVGTNWIENSSGSFLYSGTPAAGNLMGSEAPAAGTDTFGNAYLAGYTTYYYTGPSFHLYVATNTLNGTVALYTASAYGGPWSEVTGISMGLSQTVGWPSQYLALGSGAGTPVVFNDPVYGSIAAINPSNFGTKETWHPATLVNSWAASGSGTNGLFYRLTALNDLQIIGDLTSPGTASLITTLPTGYRPASAVNIPIFRYDDTGIAHALVGTDGTVTMQTTVGSGKGLFLNAHVPLGSL